MHVWNLQTINDSDVAEFTQNEEDSGDYDEALTAQGPSFGNDFPWL